VAALPKPGALLLVKVGVQPLDEIRDLGTHHRQDVRAAGCGERVWRPSGHEDVAARLHSGPRAIDRHREVALQADERLLTRMVDVRRRLITVVGIQPPVPDHEVRGHQKRIVAAGSGSRVKDPRPVTKPNQHGRVTPVTRQERTFGLVRTLRELASFESRTGRPETSQTCEVQPSVGCEIRPPTELSMVYMGRRVPGRA
jgi:hypothetical protein